MMISLLPKLPVKAIAEPLSRSSGCMTLWVAPSQCAVSPYWSASCAVLRVVHVSCKPWPLTVKAARACHATWTRSSLTCLRPILTFLVGTGRALPLQRGCTNLLIALPSSCQLPASLHVTDCSVGLGSFYLTQDAVGAKGAHMHSLDNFPHIRAPLSSGNLCHALF